MGKPSNQKKIENSVIENWTKKTSVGWLRKQRDGVIGYLEERIKKLKNTTEIKNRRTIRYHQRIDHIE